MRMTVFLVDVLGSGSASKRLQQPVEGFVADELAISDGTVPDGHVPYSLMRANGIVMLQVGFHIMPKVLLGEDSAQSCGVSLDAA